MLRTATFLALAAALLSSPANAQVPCAPRQDIAAELSVRHAEALDAAGLTAAGTVVELWTARDGRTWTIVVTAPSGQSCVIAAGESWQRVDAPRNDPAM
jgi:hypothetical protein